MPYKYSKKIREKHALINRNTQINSNLRSNSTITLNFKLKTNLAVPFNTLPVRILIYLWYHN